MEKQLRPKPTFAQKVALAVGKTGGRNTYFRYEGEPNADIGIKYNPGVYVGSLAGMLMSKSIGAITWQDIPSLLIGRIAYCQWKRARGK